MYDTNINKMPIKLNLVKYKFDPKYSQKFKKLICKFIQKVCFSPWKNILLGLVLFELQ